MLPVPNKMVRRELGNPLVLIAIQLTTEFLNCHYELNQRSYMNPIVLTEALLGGVVKLER